MFIAVSCSLIHTGLQPGDPACSNSKPFKRFPRFKPRFHTWLKPGVNKENAPQVLSDNNLRFTISKNQLQLREQRIQRLARIDHIRLAEIADVRRAVARAVSKNIAKTTARLQRRRPKRKRHVVNQKRPIGHAQTVVPTDVVANMILKQHVLQRLSAMKPQIVHIENCLDSLRDFDVDAGVVNKDSGIDKVCLALRSCCCAGSAGCCSAGPAPRRFASAECRCGSKMKTARRRNLDRQRSRRNRWPYRLSDSNRPAPKKNEPLKRKIILIDRRLQRRHV